MNLPTVLELIAKEYGLHVYRSLRMDQGYYMETNKGSKFVSVWKNPSLLHWSFSWRETLVQTGFRQVDRFIRTRGGEPYLQVRQEYLVVQDFFQGKEFSLYSIEQVEKLGSLIGLIFQTFQKTKEANPLVDKQVGLQLLKKKEQFFSLKRSMLDKRAVGLFPHLVNHHWSSLEKRWKQAVALYDLSFPQYAEGAKLPYIHVNQWKVIETGHLTFSSSCQEVVFDYQGLAQLMIELYTALDFSLEAIQTFYLAFSRQMQPTLALQYNLLAYLIYPTRFIELIIYYLDQTERDEFCAQSWLEQGQIQAQLDDLHLWFASYLDQERREIV